MKTNRTLIIAVFTAVLSLAAWLNAAEVNGGNYLPGELIVKLENGIIDLPGFDETPITSVAILDSQLVKPFQKLNVKSVEHVFKGTFARPPFTFITQSGHEVQLKDLSQVYLLRMDKTLNMEQVADELRQVPGVIYAEPNYLLTACSAFPNDPDFEYESGDFPGYYQWGLHNRYDDQPGWDINAVKAWSVETGDRDILLAILDSGLESDHYDNSGDEFYGRVTYTHDWTGYGMDDEWYFWRSSWYERARGTHVAGVIAAATNSGAGQGGLRGIAGVAGGWSNQNGVELAIGKITHKDEFPSAANIEAGIEWAMSAGSQVLNCSYASGQCPHSLKEAVENALRADMALFFPTGTAFDMVSGALTDAKPGDTINFPAKWACQNLCCAVGAMENNGYRAFYSLYMPGPTLVASGEFILSTSYDKGDESAYYCSTRGTSYASPFAAGVGALLYSSNPNLMDIDCRRIMEKTAHHNDQAYGTAPDVQTGYGCVDAWEALRHLYWPYAIEHKTVVHSQLQKTELGYGQVQFLGDQTDQIAAGTYWCDKFRFSGSVSLTSGFEETPWFWERILSEPLGYSASGNGTITTGLFGLSNTNVTTTGASFQTYTYHVKSDLLGRVIDKWVPYDTADIAIAVTALGPNATTTTHSTPVVSSTYGLYSDLAVDWYHADVPNTVHLSYYDVTNGNLRYIIDNLSGFSSSEIVDSEGDVGRFSSIALDYEGFPHIVYYDATDDMPRHAYKTLTGSWTKEPMWDRVGYAAAYNTSIAIGEVPGLAIGMVHSCCYLYAADPMPATFNGHDLAYGRRDGSGPYGWKIEPVDVTGDVGDYCSIAVDGSNIPHISYYDATNTSLKYAVRTGVDTWVTTTVDNAASLGKYTSIAIDKLDGVHISYYDETNDALKYAYREQGSGTWQIETVDPYLGLGTSICIDDDGRPVIVYGGGSGSQIRCAKKLTSGWSIQSMNSSGTAYYGTSVGIDNLGRPVASYYKDNKLYVTRRMRLPQESGYGLMMAGQNAGVEKQTNSLQPTLCLTTPNPISGSATIKYSLSYASKVHIAIFDVTGRLVVNLLDGEQIPGEHELKWDGFDGFGNQVASGVYFIQLSSPEGHVSTKFTRIR